jgi:2-dehydro-3-deoxyphosphooctonate aldolase (KDO 8-P synthase)
MWNRVIDIGRDNPFTDPLVRIGNRKDLPTIIAGPCQLQTEQHAMDIAGAMRTFCQALGFPYVFKASYDKANRTSLKGRRGAGMVEGLRILEAVRRHIRVPVTTDVHTEDEAYTASMSVDLLQIPAMLSRQTDLLVAAGKHGRAVNIKKGQGMAPEDIVHAVEKVASGGCSNIMVTDRGTSFGYHRLVTDFRGLPIMHMAGVPVCYDATHSVQLPSTGEGSGGQREFVAPLARAAVAVGVDAVFLEVHEDPDRAPSDGPCMLPLKDAPRLLAELQAIHSALHP